MVSPEAKFCKVSRGPSKLVTILQTYFGLDFLAALSTTYQSLKF